MKVVVTHYPPGADAPEWHSGDFLLVRNDWPWHSRQGVVSAAIRLGERLMDRHSVIAGTDTPAWRVNHAVGVADGHLVEAVGRGVVKTPVQAYVGADYWYFATDLTSDQRADFAGYLDFEVATRAPYGWLTIAGIVARILARGLGADLSSSHGVICSGLVTAALGIWGWRANPALVTPAELAAYHEALG